MIMIVWRVEHKVNGLGPFEASAIQRGRGHYDPPGPLEDKGLSYDWDDLSPVTRNCMSFGFEDLASYKRWFRGRMDVYERRGMVLRAFEVPRQHVLIGDWQVVFRRDKARLIEERSVCSTKWNRHVSASYHDHAKPKAA